MKISFSIFEKFINYNNIINENIIILLTLLAIIACLGFSKNSDLALSGSESYLNQYSGGKYMTEFEKNQSNILLTLGKITQGGK